MFCKIIIVSVGTFLVAVLCTADTDTQANLHHAPLQDEVIILKDGRRRTPNVTKALDGRVGDKGEVARRGHPRSRGRSDRGKRGHLDHFRSGGFDRKPRRPSATRDSHHSHGKPDHHSHGEPGHLRRGKPSCHKKRRRQKKLQIHDQRRPRGGKPRKSKLPGQSIVPLTGYMYYWGDDASTDRGREIFLSETGRANDGNSDVIGASEVIYDWGRWTYPLW